MLVYGDRNETADPRELLDSIAGQLARLRSEPAGIRRHSSLVRVLIETGQLLQGLADRDFASSGQDRRSRDADALASFLLAVATAVVRSWDSSFADMDELPDVPQLTNPPANIDLRTPEGFAFYAVYPEAYAEAARKLDLSAPPCVIGIRSIGTSLAAVVAAALGAPRFYTVRPAGEPFERQVSIGRELADELLSGAAHYVIVDEGPGLSGSSFNGIADWLESRGVPLERIAFIPSHPGPPGAHANQRHRERWGRAQKAVADLGPKLPDLLRRWAGDLLGPIDQPLKDLSGGAWRQLVYSDARNWPAVNPGWERRKYRARVCGQSWLLKFAGLGAIGERKLARARLLHSAGLVPEPRGLVHGFLVERWHGAERLGSNEKPIAEIAAYIGRRARLLPARARQGASLDDLLEMAERNVSVALGSAAAAALRAWRPRLRVLEERKEAVETDNRLDRHEWLRLGDGRLLKADALDHHSAHDLVGCQDMAWDVAGVIAEFTLGDDAAEALVAATERASGRRVDRELLDFYRIAYPAFRLGHASLSAEMCASDAAEFRRLRARADACAADLRQFLLESTGTSTRLESLIG